MKTRQGFVSNSSSSSFIVAFSHKPADQTELQSLLFDKQSDYPSPWDYCETKAWPVAEAAEKVWFQMRDKQPLTREEALGDHIGGGWIEGQPDWDEFKKDNGETDWEAMNEATDAYAAKVYDDFVAANPDAVLFGFTFSDNAGELESALEHGDLFHRLKYLVISHH